MDRVSPANILLNSICHLCLCLQIGLLSSDFRAKIFNVFLTSPERAACPAYHILLHYITPVTISLAKSTNHEAAHDAHMQINQRHFKSGGFKQKIPQKPLTADYRSKVRTIFECSNSETASSYPIQDTGIFSIDGLQPCS